MADEAPDSQPAEAAADGSDPTASAEGALDSVEHAAQAVEDAALDLPEFDDEAGNNGAAGIGLLSDVALRVKVELGRTRMYVEDVLRLNADSVIELDKAAGDPVDIYVNDRHVARGEVLVLNENFCVRVSEIVHQPEQQEQE